MKSFSAVALALTLSLAAVVSAQAACPDGRAPTTTTESVCVGSCAGTVGWKVSTIVACCPGELTDDACVVGGTRTVPLSAPNYTEQVYPSATAGAITTTTTAAATRSSTLAPGSGRSSSAAAAGPTTCPDGKSPRQVNQLNVCCPGATNVDQSNVNGVSTLDIECVVCKGEDGPSCTTVNYTDKDYTSKIYGVSTAAGTSATGSPAAAATTTATDSAGNVVSGTAPAASSSTSKAAAPAATQGPLLALAGFFAGMAML